MAVIAYVRVSTSEQADSGLGLAAQRRTIEAEAERRAWDLDWASDEGVSAKSLDRPGLQAALASLDAGEASALVVARLDRLSRSLLDFAQLLARSSEAGWELVSLDLGVDTTTPTGRFVANLMANVAQLERELIAQRTRDALAAKRKRGERLGRPVSTPEQLALRISGLRAEGRTLRDIADQLNAEAVPTVRGGQRWYPSTVRCIAERSTVAV